MLTGWADGILSPSCANAFRYAKPTQTLFGLKSLRMKIFMFFINAIYWLGIFIVPTGIMSFLGIWIYIKNESNLLYSIILIIVGLVLGIFLAEKIRRKYGLDNFFGRLSATPDIDGGNILDKEVKEN